MRPQNGFQLRSALRRGALAVSRKWKKSTMNSELQEQRTSKNDKIIGVWSLVTFAAVCGEFCVWLGLAA